MNIFVLDYDPVKAAEYHCDKHIVKMILETAQMLSTAHWLSGSQAPYKATHINHPCNVWVRESVQNYEWLCYLGVSLLDEFQYRYDNTHSSGDVISHCLANKPNLPNIGMTDFALAMPNVFKIDNSPVDSYRQYYNLGKRHIFGWKKREIPFFIDK